MKKGFGATWSQSPRRIETRPTWGVLDSSTFSLPCSCVAVKKSWQHFWFLWSCCNTTFTRQHQHAGARKKLEEACNRLYLPDLKISQKSWAVPERPFANGSSKKTFRLSRWTASGGPCPRTSNAGSQNAGQKPTEADSAPVVKRKSYGNKGYEKLLVCTL